PPVVTVEDVVVLRHDDPFPGFDVYLAVADRVGDPDRLVAPQFVLCCLERRGWDDIVLGLDALSAQRVDELLLDVDRAALVLRQRIGGGTGDWLADGLWQF